MGASSGGVLQSEGREVLLLGAFFFVPVGLRCTFGCCALAAASGRIGYLEAEAGRVKLLEARAESLATAEAQERTRAEGLQAEVGRLRSGLRARTWALVLVLVAFAVVVGAAVLPALVR